MLAEFADPRTAPEMLSLREQIRGWRFYDHFRSDSLAPARWPQVGTRTPVLGHEGSDLAAAWATICEVGDAQALEAAVDDAFAGARIEVRVLEGQFGVRVLPGEHVRERGGACRGVGLQFLDGGAQLLEPVGRLHGPDVARSVAPDGQRQGEEAQSEGAVGNEHVR